MSMDDNDEDVNLVGPSFQSVRDQTSLEQLLPLLPTTASSRLSLEDVKENNARS
jgi:hypothetical protein